MSSRLKSLAPQRMSLQLQYTMPYPIVKLKPQRPERIGHPWVYDNEIAVGPPKRL